MSKVWICKSLARSAINCLARLIVERVEGASRVRDAARDKVAA